MNVARSPGRARLISSGVVGLWVHIALSAGAEPFAA